MKIKHIKANGIYYSPQEPNAQDPKKRDGCFLPVCKITRRLFGRWQIDLFDDMTQFYINKGYMNGDENTPNVTIYLYPSGIEEIKYIHEPKR